MVEPEHEMDGRLFYWIQTKETTELSRNKVNAKSYYLKPGEKETPLNYNLLTSPEILLILTVFLFLSFR